MFSRLEVINAANQTLTLLLENEGTGYILLDMDGLGPVKATIASSKFANFDGVQFQSATRDGRNITLKLAFEPDYSTQTVQSLRQALYSYFLPKLPVKLRFKVDKKLIYEISGYVETCEPTVFGREPAVDVSIFCTLPDFLDSTTTTFPGNSVADLTETALSYTGSVDTGFLFTLFPDRSITDVALNVRRPDGVLQTLSCAFSDPIVAGDTLAISTVKMAKSASVTHSSVVTNRLNKVSAASVWMPLYPGTNLVRVAIAGAAVPYIITYKNAYGGL